MEKSQTSHDSSAGGGSEIGTAVSALYDLTLKLRQECPWDRAQTAATIVPHTIEEAYEVAEALRELPSGGAFGSIDNPAGDVDASLTEFADELGDLLFQVCFLSMWCNEHNNDIDLASVARGIHDKLVYRHPHIFETAVADSADAVRSTWEDIKRKEKPSGDEIASVFDGVAKGLPPLQHARKVHHRAAQAGFDFDNAHAALDKVEDELRELREALTAARDSGTLPVGESMQPDANVSSEIGDVMFSLVNLARTTRTDPDLSLRDADHRFMNRVRQAEILAHADGHIWADLERDNQESYYQKAKSGFGLDA